MVLTHAVFIIYFQQNAIMPDIPTEGFESKDTPDDNDDNEQDPSELWELKHIFTAKELSKSKANKCQTANCSLVACSAWATKSAPQDLWFTCLDCQATDYEGWPTDVEELPVGFLTLENRNKILELCTVNEEVGRFFSFVCLF